jgi:hypothetical protein
VAKKKPRSMKAAAADNTPVSTMDRTRFVILLFVNLLHICFLLGEANCQQIRFRMGVDRDSAETKKKSRTYKICHAGSN